MLGGCGLGLVVIVFLVGVLDMSGWMLMGFLGFMYVIGFLSLWFVVGLFIGVYLNYLIFVLCFCIYMEVVNDFIIISDFFENCFGDYVKIFWIVLVIVIFIFFIFYILVGMVLGGWLFELVFGVNY